MFRTINTIKQIEERTFSIAYTCIAVSKHYFKLQQFDEAWSWAIKAIFELHKNSGHLKTIVQSHGRKVCTVLGELNIANMLKSQMSAYNAEISDHTLYHLSFYLVHFFLSYTSKTTNFIMLIS